MSKQEKIQAHFTWDAVSSLIHKGEIKAALDKIGAAIAAGKNLCKRVIEWLQEQAQTNQTASGLLAKIN